MTVIEIDIVEMLAMLVKPAYGAPCTNCGVCCTMSQCQLSEGVLGKQVGACPALEKLPDGKGFGCGLMLNPQDYAPARTAVRGRTVMIHAAKHILGAGFGCDCKSPLEPENPEYEARRDERAADQTHVRESFAAWGIQW